MSPPRSDAPAPRRGPSWGRRLRNTLTVAACYACAAIVIIPLLLIVSHLLARGVAGLTPEFFLHMPKPVGEPGGGMANAIVGTLILIGIGMLFAVPVGVGCGVYLAEYGAGRFA